MKTITCDFYLVRPLTDETFELTLFAERFPARRGDLHVIRLVATGINASPYDGGSTVEVGRCEHAHKFLLKMRRRPVKRYRLPKLPIARRLKAELQPL